ncbi:hypothetical protein TURU_003675 [Turdus rufiventris]|nr:hypothetical protein TURU_003675 [Turdus rufiventris]
MQQHGLGTDPLGSSSSEKDLVDKKLPMSQQCVLGYIRKSIASRVSEHWSKLSKKVVESPSLQIFQNHLEALLCHVLWDDHAPVVVPSNLTIL